MITNPGRRAFIKKSISLATSLVFTGCGGGGSGSGTSLDAQLTVTAPPSILAQPSDQSVTEGENAFFQVIADGTLPLSYQWQRDAVDIPGAKDTSYTTVPLSLGDDATFTVTITNAAGAITSRNALLTVSPISITIDSTTITVDSLLVTADRL